MDLLYLLTAIWKVSPEDSEGRRFIKIGVLCVAVAAIIVVLIRML